jgi:hypothetical protein
MLIVRSTCIIPITVLPIVTIVCIIPWTILRICRETIIASEIGTSIELSKLTTKICIEVLTIAIRSSPAEPLDSPMTKFDERPGAKPPRPLLKPALPWKLPPCPMKPAPRPELLCPPWSPRSPRSPRPLPGPPPLAGPKPLQRCSSEACRQHLLPPDRSRQRSTS